MSALDVAALPSISVQAAVELYDAAAEHLADSVERSIRTRTALHDRAIVKVAISDRFDPKVTAIHYAGRIERSSVDRNELNKVLTDELEAVDKLGMVNDGPVLFTVHTGLRRVR